MTQALPMARPVKTTIKSSPIPFISRIECSQRALVLFEEDLFTHGARHHDSINPSEHPIGQLELLASAAQDKPF